MVVVQELELLQSFIKKLFKTKEFNNMNSFFDYLVKVSLNARDSIEKILYLCFFLKWSLY